MDIITRVTTASVVKESKSMVVAQVSTFGHRGENIDSTICTDPEVKLLGRAVKNKDELYKMTALNNKEQQQAGCLKTSEKRRATQIDDQGSKNNNPEANFDTKMKVLMEEIDTASR